MSSPACWRLFCPNASAGDLPASAVLVASRLGGKRFAPERRQRLVGGIPDADRGADRRKMEGQKERQGGIESTRQTRSD